MLPAAEPEDSKDFAEGLPPAPPALQLAYGGNCNLLCASMQRQLEALESRLTKQITRVAADVDWQVADVQRRVCADVLPKLEKRMAEMGGHLKALTQEMHIQVVRLDTLHAKFNEWKVEQEMPRPARHAPDSPLKAEISQLGHLTARLQGRAATHVKENPGSPLAEELSELSLLAERLARGAGLAQDQFPAAPTSPSKERGDVLAPLEAQAFAIGGGASELQEQVDRLADLLRDVESMCSRRVSASPVVEDSARPTSPTVGPALVPAAAPTWTAAAAPAPVQSAVPSAAPSVVVVPPPAEVPARTARVLNFDAAAEAGSQTSSPKGGALLSPRGGASPRSANSGGGLSGGGATGAAAVGGSGAAAPPSPRTAARRVAALDMMQDDMHQASVAEANLQRLRAGAALLGHGL